MDIKIVDVMKICYIASLTMFTHVMSKLKYVNICI